MDARPTAEQRELTDAADRLGGKLGPAAVGDLADTDRRARLDAAIAQAGWPQLRNGTADEPWASGVEAAFVARALARRACDTAFIGPVLATDLLRRAGAADDTDRAIGVTGDLAGLATGAGLAIDSGGADTAVRLGADPADSAEVEVAPIAGALGNGVDLTRTVARLGQPGESVGRVGTDALTAWEALAVTLTAADLVGAMEGTIELATEYARQRRQYGATIGSFQAVQHLLAEAQVLAEGSYSAMIHAAWAVDELTPGDALQAAAVAKAYAGRAPRTVCETSIQVHGGIGNTWECMAHVYLRRALLSTDLFGGPDAQLTRLARLRWAGQKAAS